MSRQYQTEAGQYDNETATKQYQTGSGLFVNETVAAAAAAGEPWLYYAQQHQQAA
jgi:hypothetical protein